MKKWNEIVLETNDNIKFSTEFLSSSSLYKEFSKQEHNELIKKLEKINNPNIKMMLKEMKESDDYTTPVTVKFNGMRFSLYGNSGRLRIGATDHDRKILDKNFNFEEFLKAL